jgi:hypothetical protein
MTKTKIKFSVNTVHFTRFARSVAATLRVTYIITLIFRVDTY